MKTTHMIEVNLVEGLFFNELWHVVGAWNNNLKIIIAKHPCIVTDDILTGLSLDQLNKFTGYELLDGRTDSFTLSAWNPKTYSHTPLYEFVK